MVHNGIEYGDIQLIDEAYFLMKTVTHICVPCVCSRLPIYSLVLSLCVRLSLRRY